MGLTKKVLLIGNPGKEGDKNYAPQVYDVLDQYKSFFISPVGGSFALDDILELKGCLCSANEESCLSSFIMELDQVNYSIIVFVGHGRDNNRSDEIQLSFGSFWPVGSFFMSKNPQMLKRTIIIDACRIEAKIQAPVILNESFDYRAQGFFNRYDCKNYYDELIENTEPHIDLIQSTQKGCPAFTTGKGTVFNDNLFNQIGKQIQKWNVKLVNGNPHFQDKINFKDEVDELKGTMIGANQIPEFIAIGGSGSFPLMCCKF